MEKNVLRFYKKTLNGVKYNAYLTKDGFIMIDREGTIEDTHYKATSIYNDDLFRLNENKRFIPYKVLDAVKKIVDDLKLNSITKEIKRP